MLISKASSSDYAKELGIRNPIQEPRDSGCLTGACTRPDGNGLVVLQGFTAKKLGNELSRAANRLPTRLQPIRDEFVRLELSDLLN